ncbi:autotransporter outer membrane beta-barrel domain-containing protein [Pseudomonas rustica]|uniref:autotransporter outer membrane beta-barrel domain-containing protein n=1 Tax=Pseudomonas rustica TaxID=2827099 RepID=UPI0020164C4C|nr:autotransporter outer membrane beta-barrel domain-containing protein [Pseudomonas rustica]
MCCLQALMLPGDYAQAATIVDNATLDINSSVPATDYLVRNNGVLNASGANTRSITAQTGSTLNISGTTVVGNAGNEGVVVTSSKGTIDQTSITSDDIGLAVNRSSVAAGGSSVTVSNSRITGDVAGAQVTGLSTLSLINTQVTGAGANGIGVNILGGEVNASAGTHITGQSTGVRIVNDSANVGARTLSLDNATVQGVDGSAILVERGTQAIIHILNGSTLLAGNNILLDIQGASAATVAVAGSSLTGNINVAAGSNGDISFEQSQMTGDVLVNGTSTTTLNLAGNSNLSGNMRITDGSTGHLNFEQSTMTGDVLVDASTATVNLGYGSALEGNVNVTGNSLADLALDQSQMKGDVIVNGASSANLSVAANSALTGKIDITGGSTGHLNFNQGHMAGDVRVNDSTATIAFANGSSLEGDVNFTGNSVAELSFDQSQMKGDVLIDGVASTPLKFTNQSALNGNVDIANGSRVDLGFDRSQMTGDTLVKGASTANLNVTANSLLTGAVDIAEGSTGNLNFNQGHMAGDVRVNDSTATVAFANGSTLEGDVNVTGNSVAELSFDQSQMKGDVLIDGLPDTTAVNFANNSVLTGNVNIAGGSNVDLRFDQSQLTGDVRVAGNSTTQMALNNSTFLGNLSVSDDSTANLTLNQSQMTGDVLINGLNTTESVTLENQSQLTGRLDKVNSVNIKSQSNWTLTGNDNIGTLAMNGGSVTFGAAEATSTYYTLNVGTLAGTTGTFVMKGDFVSGESDKLIVAGQSTGNYGLAVAASGLDAVAPEQVVLVRTGTTDGASFTLAGDRAVDLGTWSYSLASRTNAEGGKEWYLDPTTEVISPGAQSILALFNTPVTSWYGEQSSLRTRMGELRLNGGQSGGWMRTYGGQYNVADGSGVGYQQNQQGISLGADARLGDSQWLAGVVAGMSESDLNLDHGTTGTVKSYYVGPYLTWMSDKGYYFDGVLKFNRFRNESKVNLSDDTRAKGDYDNWGLGASAEFGRQFKLADGYFIEPFTQWSAVQIQGKRYTLDNDMTADGDTTRSLLGKAGVTVGRNFEFGKASIAQPYLRMAVAHEFAKNNEVKVNDNVFNNDLSGTRGEFGAGVAVAMSEKWQVHADFDYSNGEHIEKPWGATLGVRWFW